MGGVPRWGWVPWVSRSVPGFGRGFKRGCGAAGGFRWMGSGASFGAVGRCAFEGEALVGVQARGISGALVDNGPGAAFRGCRIVVARGPGRRGPDGRGRVSGDGSKRVSLGGWVGVRSSAGPRLMQRAGSRVPRMPDCCGAGAGAKGAGWPGPGFRGWVQARLLGGLGWRPFKRRTEADATGLEPRSRGCSAGCVAGGRRGGVRFPAILQSIHAYAIAQDVWSPSRNPTKLSLNSARVSAKLAPRSLH